METFGPFSHSRKHLLKVSPGFNSWPLCDHPSRVLPHPAAVQTAASPLAVTQTITAKGSRLELAS
jgi:hypothetical protein